MTKDEEQGLHKFTVWWLRRVNNKFYTNFTVCWGRRMKNKFYTNLRLDDYEGWTTSFCTAMWLAQTITIAAMRLQIYSLMMSMVSEQVLHRFTVWWLRTMKPKFYTNSQFDDGKRMNNKFYTAMWLAAHNYHRRHRATQYADWGLRMMLETGSYSYRSVHTMTIATIGPHSADWGLRMVFETVSRS